MACYLCLWGSLQGEAATCYGDFNEALSHDEHFGSSDRYAEQMLMFKECLDYYGLSNLGYSDRKSTWTNKHECASYIGLRLDRVVTNGAFTQLFGDCHVENVITMTSYYYSVVIGLKNY
jgi:hypothetical protein